MEGQEYQRGAQVKDNMHSGDAGHGDGIVPEGEAEEILNQIGGADKQHRADDVEVKVDHSGPLGVFVRAHAGNQGGDAGADVLAHDDGKRCGKSDCPGGGHRLENAHRGGGALDDGGYRGPGQDAQHRVGQGGKEGLKGRGIRQRLHGVRHDEHPIEQDAEAQQNLAHKLGLALFPAHQDHNANQRDDRRQGGGLQNGHNRSGGSAPVQIAQAQNQRGYRGADIRAHNHAHGIVQLENPGVYQSDHNDRGGRGALNGGGDDNTQKKAFEQVAGQPFQGDLHLAACQLFQPGAQDVHSEQEESQPAQHGSDA